MGSGFASSGPEGYSVRFDFTAVSGPSGENPSGRLSVFDTNDSTSTGDVTCLTVVGNRAVIGVDNEVERDPSFPVAGALVFVVDGGPAASGQDTVSVDYLLDTIPSPATCLFPPSVPPASRAVAVVSGDIEIHDAPALPRAKDQCENGGWKSFGIFKNQGDCVSFVATGGKNPPALGTP